MLSGVDSRSAASRGFGWRIRRTHQLSSAAVGMSRFAVHIARDKMKADEPTILNAKSGGRGTIGRSSRYSLAAGRTFISMETSFAFVPVTKEQKMPKEKRRCEDGQIVWEGLRWARLLGNAQRN
jgi:hypothetical protein